MQQGRWWKTAGRCAIAVSVCCAASVGWAATIGATVTRSGGDWTLTWTGLSCNFVDFFNATTPPRTWALTVAGATAGAPLAGSNYIGGPPDIGTVDLTAPNGSLTLATLDGATSFACGADTLTLPGHAPLGAAAIPTLSEWCLIAMAALLGAAGLARLRLRGRTRP